MTEPADFLSRWSQRKRAAAKGVPDREADPKPGPVNTPEAGAPETRAKRGDENTDGEASNEGRREQPDVDLSNLPSIETITAETDIRPFLAARVPAALRQAALRRMWSADPAIRDFIEMAENQWDFNAGAVPGFNIVAPAGEVKRVLADFLGETRDSESRSDSQPEHSQAVQPVEAVPVTPDVAVRCDTPDQQARKDPETSFAALQRDADALQSSVPPKQGEMSDLGTPENDATRDTAKLLVRRSHGGAMPK